MYSAQPIGRAHRFTRDDFAAILTAMGRTVEETETLPELAARINRAVDPTANRFLVNLRTLRAVSGFADAGAVTHRGHVVSRPKSRHAEPMYAGN